MLTGTWPFRVKTPSWRHAVLTRRQAGRRVEVSVFRHGFNNSDRAMQRARDRYHKWRDRDDVRRRYRDLSLCIDGQP